jgi:hypothetical protein
MSRRFCIFGSAGLGPPQAPVHTWGRCWGGPTYGPGSRPGWHLSWSVLQLSVTVPPGPALLLCPGKGWGQLSRVLHPAEFRPLGPVVSAPMPPGPALQPCPSCLIHSPTTAWLMRGRAGSPSLMPSATSEQPLPPEPAPLAVQARCRAHSPKCCPWHVVRAL